MSGCHAGCRDLHYNPESIRFCHRLSARNTQKHFYVHPFGTIRFPDPLYFPWPFFLLFHQSCHHRRGILWDLPSFLSEAFFHALPCLHWFPSLAGSFKKQSLLLGNAFLHLFIVCPGFYMGRIHKDLTWVYQFKFIAFLQLCGKISAQKGQCP